MAVYKHELIDARRVFSRVCREVCLTPSLNIKASFTYIACMEWIALLEKDSPAYLESGPRTTPSNV